MEGTAPSRGRRRLLRAGLVLGGLGLLGCTPRARGPTPPPVPTPPPAWVPRIGYLLDGPDRVAPEAFLRGLRERGHVDGETVAIELRVAGFAGDPPFPAMVEDVLRRGARLLVADGDDVIRVAMRVAPATPLVVVYGGNPVADGLVASLDRPGGAVTGVAHIPVEVWGRRLALLKAMAPAVSRASALWTPPGTVGVENAIEALKQAAEPLGLGILPHDLNFRMDRELDRALADIEAARPDALVVLAHPHIGSREYRAVELARRYRWPTIVTYADTVRRHGALMACWTTRDELRHAAAAYVDRILSGADPAELPIGRLADSHFVLNLGAVRELGLTVPESVLAQATELIP